MKILKNISLVVMFCLITTALFAQDNNKTAEKLKLIAGVRVNPLIVYDFEGNTNEFLRLHAEFGALLNKKFYVSAGYTAVANAVYNFNEYWFIGFDKKVPVSWVIAEEYMIDENKWIIQSGLNVKLSKIGNVFAFLFTPTDNFNLGLKAGVFIPLNVVLMKR